MQGLDSIEKEAVMTKRTEQTIQLKFGLAVARFMLVDGERAITSRTFVTRLIILRQDESDSDVASVD